MCLNLNLINLLFYWKVVPVGAAVQLIRIDQPTRRDYHSGDYNNTTTNNNNTARCSGHIHYQLPSDKPISCQSDNNSELQQGLDLDSHQGQVPECWHLATGLLHTPHRVRQRKLSGFDGDAGAAAECEGQGRPGQLAGSDRAQALDSDNVFVGSGPCRDLAVGGLESYIQRYTVLLALHFAIFIWLLLFEWGPKTLRIGTS